MLRHQGEKVKFQGQLKGQQLTVSELDVVAFQISRRLNWWGNLLCRLVPGWTSCKLDVQATATLNLPQEPSLVDAELDWQENSGQSIGLARDNGSSVARTAVANYSSTIQRKRWSLELAVCRFSFQWPTGRQSRQSGRQGSTTLWSADDSGALTQGKREGNAALKFGPGKLNMDNSQLPLQTDR
ncbi:intermembrane phospholipid transport protein YdbH family protein [Escherichia coli]